MANLELDDSAQAMQAKETEHAVPVGFWVLFWGLIAWGIYYFFTYVGWDQAADVNGGGAGLGSNVTYTVLFTVAATAAAVGLAVAMSRRARGKR
jgi:hypothetical protein